MARLASVVAVNNAFRLAPWASALAANDRAWWRANPDAMEFEGRKFSANQIDDVERIIGAKVGTDSCSGVLGLEVAKRLGATQIALIGADFRGDHFFGKYQSGLRNTTPERRKVHERQFRSWAKANPAVSVVNATAGSALPVFPLVSIREFFGLEGLGNAE